MPRTVGIFDPGFSTIGHFVSFNRYVAELIGDDFQVVFLDFGDRMKKAYEGKLSLKYQPRFVPIIEPPIYPGKLTLKSLLNFQWWVRRWNDFHWIKRAFSNIEKAGVDLVIISSQTTPFIFLQRPRFPYCVIIQYPILVKARESLSGIRKIFIPIYDYFIDKYMIFLRKAKVVFTTNDPTMPFSFPGAIWLPTNLDLREPMRPMGTIKRKFITIGVVSKAKNHDFALDAFEKFNLPFSYLIAGMPTDEVGQNIKKRVLHSSNSNIKGMFENIPADQYESLINETDYLILPYDFRMQTRGASQVLYDAFRNLTPIIAPNIEPFKDYVERYGVGFLYKEGDIVAFKKVIEKAVVLSKIDFVDNFKQLYDDYSFNEIKKNISGKIKSCFMD